jgi:uncharacterized protein
VEAVLAEVTNTLWGERHAYALSESNGGRVLTGRSGKVLHVSPFMGMDHEYEWRASVPGERLSVHIESRRGASVPSTPHSTWSVASSRGARSPRPRLGTL